MKFRRFNTYGICFGLVLLVTLLTASTAWADASLPPVFGDRGSNVTELQQYLKATDYFNSDPSGYFGLVTLASVMKLQQDLGATANGQLNFDQYASLKEAAVSGNKPQPPPAQATKKIVLGYYTKDYPGDVGSYNSLAQNSQLLNYIATFTARITGQGDLITDNIPTEAVALAKQEGVKPLLLIHNMNNGMDSAAADSVLSNPNYRQKLESNILQLVNQNGYDGVNIDLEAVPAADKQYYTTFLQELGGLLHPAGLLLTASIPAKTGDLSSDDFVGAYDYNAIGQACDYVTLMTYDEHWFGGSPGAIASLPWVQQVLDYAVGQIPKNKILMGIAAYGYDWSASGTNSVTWSQAEKLANEKGVQVQWDNASSSPYFVYWENGETHTVWFENQYSMAIKLNLVNSYGIAGIAFWRMGYEDSSFWSTIQNNF